MRGVGDKGGEGPVRVGPGKVCSKRAWLKDKWGLGWVQGCGQAVCKQGSQLNM